MPAHDEAADYPAHVGQVKVFKSPVENDQIGEIGDVEKRARHVAHRVGQAPAHVFACQPVGQDDAISSRTTTASALPKCVSAAMSG